LAQSGHANRIGACPLSGGIADSFHDVMSVFDPKRTLRVLRNGLSVVRHFSLAAWSQSARL
jgi:hypothetical protein